MKKIYFDYAATTPVDKEVLKAMLPFFSKTYGNPSEVHFLGQEAKRNIDQSRKIIADFLKAEPEEVIFTSGATESINLAHKGLVEALSCQGKPHLIVSAVEHKAVLATCQHLEKLGLATITYLPVDKFGMIDLRELEKEIRSETVLVSVMYVNNEVGTIQPIKEIGRLLKRINQKRKKKVFFHTDATQAISYLDCQVDQLGVDLLSFTGHKIYAPKGVGVLYVRKGTRLARQQDGGGQEFNLRSGTENVPYIVALGKAVALLSTQKFKLKTQKLKKLTQKLIVGVLQIPGIKLTGHPTLRVPHIASFVIKNSESESMLLLLSDKGIAAAAVSACNSASLQPSHVLKAMRIPEDLLNNSLRFSLGKDSQEEEVDEVLKSLKEVINYLRELAPKLDEKDN